MAISSNFPAIRPTLNLAFSETKVLDPRITFTRASTGTFYDGKTVTKAEENLLIRSQEFDNASWVKSNVTITANDAVAPDGSSTADRAVATAGTYHTRYAHLQGVSSTFSSPTWFVLSFWIKSATGSNQNLSLEFVRQGTGYLNFAVEATPTWQRFVYAVEVASSGTRLDAGIANSAAGDAFDVHIWGAQLEQRSSVTAYTPTTTQPITNYIPVLQTAAANVARFDHNPVTGESLGLLIEEARTNLLLRSAEFDNASWTKTNATISPNAVVAPDGTLTGDKLVESATTNTPLFFQDASLTSGVTYTQTIYAKAGERTVLQIAASTTITGSGSSYQNYDLSNGTLGGSLGSGVATITHVGNGWYRCSYAAAATSTANGRMAFYVVASSTAARAESYQGNGFSGIYIWGAQLEAGAFPTSYIPTVAAQATRQADAATMTGTNFSSWYRQGEGTLYAEGATRNNVDGATGASAQNVAPLVGLGDSLTNQLRLDRNDTGARAFRAQLWFRTAAQNIGIEITSDNSYPPLVPTKMAAAMRAYDYALSSQGSVVGTTAEPQGVIQGPLLIGQSPYAVGDNQRINGHIRKVAYWPTRLTNAQLVALTTP